MRTLFILLLALLVMPVQATTLEKELGLTVLPTQTQPEQPMVVFLSGDGGWAALDKGLSRELQLRGMPVVGWSSLHYYWHAKTPDQAAQDLSRLLESYQARWHRQTWLLVGFSFGAEIVPFVIHRLPAEQQASLVGAVMLSPSTASDFEIHVSDIVSSSKSSRYLTQPEVTAISKVPMLCMQGRDDDDDDRLCPLLAQPNVSTITLDGGHHFVDDYPLLANQIVKGLHL